MKKVLRLGGKTSRGDALRYLLVALGLYSFASFEWGALSANTRFLRPPGALPENDFLANCIRCGLCKEVCVNQCIRMFESGSGKLSGTPGIVPREQGCILCMKCTRACPSGALRPLADDIASIRKNVNMGKAVLDKNICYSYNNRICGICYRACPLQDEALKIGAWEKPILDRKKCVGCGLCERICYHYPQAIKVIPV